MMQFIFYVKQSQLNSVLSLQQVKDEILYALFKEQGTINKKKFEETHWNKEYHRG